MQIELLCRTFHRIRKINAATGTIATIAGNGSPGYSGDGGSPTSASLSSPRSIEVDKYGYLYMAQGVNHVVRMIGIDGNISTIAGNGTAGFSGDGGQAAAAQVNIPRGIGFHRNAPSKLYIVDTDNHKVRKVDMTINARKITGWSEPRNILYSDVNGGQSNGEH